MKKVARFKDRQAWFERFTEDDMKEFRAKCWSILRRDYAWQEEIEMAEKALGLVSGFCHYVRTVKPITKTQEFIDAKDVSIGSRS